MKDWWYNNWRVFVPILISLLLGSGGVVGLVKFISEARKKKEPASIPHSMEKEEVFIYPKQPNVEYSLGKYAFERGEYEQALEHFISSAKDYERKDTYSYDHAAALICAGVACSFLTQYDDARKSYDHARAILEINYKKNAREIAWIWNNMGNDCVKEDKLGEALQMHLNALEIKKRFFGEKSITTGVSYLNVGGVLYTQGKGDEALEYSQKALKTFNKESTMEYAAMTNYNIGNILRSQEKYGEAWKYYLDALFSYEALYGSEHLMVAQLYHYVGLMYAVQGEYEKAIPFCYSAYRVGREKLSDEHPNTRMWLGSLMASYGLAGKKDFAKWLAEQLERKEPLP